jgi:AcrR family transcriptional regulator
MARTGGVKTRKRILEKAEELFSKDGFQGTSVNRIAQEAQVNKALIYYHFKDKNDIILSLFRSILEEFSSSDSPALVGLRSGTGLRDIPGALRAEVSFLEKRRNILAVMLMESLKTDDRDMSLFRCAELAMSSELRGAKTKSQLFHEFFTGFIPLIAFVALKEKWCDFFQCDRDEALGYFVESFIASHVDTHP